MKKDLLTKYASLAIKTGVNIQKGQHLIIAAPIETHEFTKILVEQAYLAGAGLVHVLWNDEPTSLLHLTYADENLLATVDEWEKARLQYFIDHKAARLSITCSQPGLMDSINPQKIGKITALRNGDEAVIKYRRFVMAGNVQWCVIAHPSLRWAKKVYPHLNDEESFAKLWKAILDASRVNDDSDAVANWELHNNALSSRNKYLNEQNFDALHFKNSLGTDLTVGLAKGHIWEGGADFSNENIRYNPNIPTEENFTMPDFRRVNGKVVASLPLSYQGQIIDEFFLDFKDGVVINSFAKTNDELLTALLNMDQGSRSLGEVALIPFDSPIRKTNTLFYNTLFDENASCHLALGASYPNNLKGGTALSKEELLAKGGNHSLIHEDFMFGTADMEVTGIKEDGSRITIIKDGKFLFN